VLNVHVFVVVGLGEIAQLQFQFVQFAPTIPLNLYHAVGWG
jgi:hypothetical protein